MGSGGTNPGVLNVGTRHKWVAGFTLQKLYWRQPVTHSRYRRCREKENSLPPRNIEIRIVGRATRNLVTVMTELPMTMYGIKYRLYWEQ